MVRSQYNATCIRFYHASQPEPTMIRFAIALVLAAGIHLGNVIAEEEAQQATPTEFKVRPIGHVQKMGERIVVISTRNTRRACSDWSTGRTSR